ncbi:MAG: hypothetical protein G8345_20060 [Magnetococcales bacterium]|nr:hypothetical protein [Magnetococcales bacterium]NGZ29167.1 hypothetical protein [Magnetococcales bacterium]
MFRLFPFDAHTRIEILEEQNPHAHNHSLESEVQRLWQLALSKRKTPLTDGRIFSLTHIQPGLLQGVFIPYRYFVAQLEAPELYPTLQVQTMAVSGLLQCQDGIVWGRRHPDTVFGGNMMELVPSGGLSRQAIRSGRIDVGQQIIIELQEEIGIPAAMIPEPRPFCCFEDTILHVWDVGMELQLPCNGAQLLKYYEKQGCWEYSSLSWVAEDQLSSFIADHEEQILPLSKEMVRHWLASRTE